MYSARSGDKFRKNRRRNEKSASFIVISGIFFLRGVFFSAFGLLGVFFSSGLFSIPACRSLVFVRYVHLARYVLISRVFRSLISVWCSELLQRGSDLYVWGFFSATLPRTNGRLSFIVAVY